MNLEFLRNKMVDEQIAKRGIKDLRVLNVMRQAPRHQFVLSEDIPLAYSDCPIPIGEGQTISQPYIVALMTEALALKGGERVLEIGTGSGYQTAILAFLCKEVCSIERVGPLAQRAQQTLEKLGYQNIKLRQGDGTLGWPEDILFDAIIVTAASPEDIVISEEFSLSELKEETAIRRFLEQLKDGGRLVIPAGGHLNQKLYCFLKEADRIKSRKLCHCIFVSLIGELGWNNE